MKIIFENESGGVSIVNFPPQENKRNWKILPRDKYIEHVVNRSVPRGVSYETVNDNMIPTDRTFRGAWRKGPGRVEVDMPKSRQIHMDRIRAVRNIELDKTDKELTKELENGPASKALKDKRQALRDIPQTFDLESATTQNQLKAKWPADLPRP